MHKFHSEACKPRLMIHNKKIISRILVNWKKRLKFGVKNPIGAANISTATKGIAEHTICQKFP